MIVYEWQTCLLIFHPESQDINVYFHVGFPRGELRRVSPMETAVEMLSVRGNFVKFQMATFQRGKVNGRRRKNSLKIAGRRSVEIRTKAGGTASRKMHLHGWTRCGRFMLASFSYARAANVSTPLCIISRRRRDATLPSISMLWRL